MSKNTFFFVVFSPFCCEIAVLLEKKFGGFVFFFCTFAADNQKHATMVGMITSRDPIKGAVAKEMQQHISRVAEAKKLGTAVRATSQHKTNVNLIEVNNE